MTSCGLAPPGVSSANVSHLVQVLCEDIAIAVDGSPERRLGNALRLAERLRGLENRRHEYEEAKRTREALGEH